MDFSMVSAAASALALAKEFGKAALGIRDFNEIASIVTQLNDQLLKAQDALFAHQAQLLALQGEHFETTQELRKMKEAIAERGRYSLFELSLGVFVYRLNVAPINSDAGNPISTEPKHYLCQPCFDAGVKAVLIRRTTNVAVNHHCPSCKNNFVESELPSSAPRRYNHDPFA